VIDVPPGHVATMMANEIERRQERRDLLPHDCIGQARASTDETDPGNRIYHEESLQLDVGRGL
jgi:hypothetical protein